VDRDAAVARGARCGRGDAHGKGRLGRGRRHDHHSRGPRTGQGTVRRNRCARARPALGQTREAGAHREDRRPRRAGRDEVQRPLRPPRRPRGLQRPRHQPRARARGPRLGVPALAARRDAARRRSARTRCSGGALELARIPSACRPGNGARRIAARIPGTVCARRRTPRARTRRAPRTVCDFMRRETPALRPPQLPARRARPCAPRPGSGGSRPVRRARRRSALHNPAAPAGPPRPTPRAWAR